MQLNKKTAVITGGTSGIGLAAASLFTQQGARVVAVGRHDADAARKAVGASGAVITADVTAPADLKRLFSDVAQRFGKVDVLFVNAAQVKLAPIADTSDALFDEIVGVNMKGAFSTLRTAIPHLADGASVILTTSWLNRIGFPGASVASMTKAALRSLARVAAAELAPRGIRVNALCPGAIETPLWGKLGLPAETLSAAGAQITAQIPLGRWGQAEEVAEAALFLASPASRYVNGMELNVDGGMRQV
jgi:NAD(P)-dependent dehydrogenase (short-subunit alcohol dehydrogenase family)